MRLALLLAALAPSLALAQVGLADHADRSRGATLLPRSVAWAEGSTASQYNPAGLNKVPLGELSYAHERSGARRTTIDGFYTAVGMFGFGGGLAVEWVREDSGAAWTKTSLGFAAGMEAISIGLGLGFFGGGPVDAISTVELSLQTRPWRWFSAGFTVRNLNAPSTLTATFSRSYQLGVGLRLFGERLTVGADFLVSEGNATGGPAGFPGGRMGYSLELETFRGVKVWAGVSHGVIPNALLYLQGGLSIDTSHVGVGYAASGSRNGVNHLVIAHASIDPVRGIDLFPGKLLLIPLSGLKEDEDPASLGSLLGVRGKNRYLQALINLQQAERDPNVDGVLLKIEGSGLGLGRAVELRQAILKLKAQGKKVYAYLLSATDAEYLVASTADQIYAAHDAMLQLDGLSASVLFFGGTMEKLGVSWDVARVGEFKNAPDMFNKSEMSSEQRTAIDAYLDTDQKVLEQAITGARGLTPAAYQSAVDEGLKSMRRAKELKLIDEILVPTEIERRLDTALPGVHAVTEAGDEARTGRWGRKPQLAVLPVIGNIAGGEDSNGDPLGLGGPTAGARTFIRNLEGLVRDPNVRAIVIRVDSSGGDGMASDLMYRAVLEARKRKPVIASMGDVAASGGYYVAMGAEEIWANPTTITGSIGVFVLKPALQKLGESLGVHQETIRRGAQAGVFDLWEPWTPQQSESAQKWVDDFYETFITEVADCRKMSKPAVDSVARGRVWSGADAKEKGLVDQLGGLADALASARGRSGLGGTDDYEVILLGGSGGILGAALAESAAARGLMSIQTQRDPKLLALEKLAGELGVQALPAPGTVQARMEFRLDVR
jgi:protease IV